MLKVNEWGVEGTLMVCLGSASQRSWSPSRNLKERVPSCDDQAIGYSRWNIRSTWEGFFVFAFFSNNKQVNFETLSAFPK